MRISNASGVNLTGNQNIYFFLHLINGKINTGANKLIMGAGTTITGAGASSYINGALQQNIPTGATVSISFPVGDADSYSPADLNFSNVSTAGNITAAVLNGDHPNVATSAVEVSKSVNQYWDIDNSGVVFATCDVMFNWVAGDVDGAANTANFGIRRYNGTAWSAVIATNQTATSVRGTGITTFSDFQIGELFTTNDYRSSLNGGSWGSAGSWQRFNGTTWVAAAAAPTAATANVITIRNGFDITVTANVTTDQTIIETGATLTVQSSILNFTVSNGAGSDLTVNGNLVWQQGANTGTLVLNSSAVIDGASSLYYTGINMINNGTINVPVTFGNTLNSQTVNGGPHSYSSLIINNPFDVSFVSGASPTTSQLNFVNGRISTIGATVSISEGGSITGASASRYISGQLQRAFGLGTSTLDFPIGRNSFYTPLSVTLNSVTTPATISVFGIDSDNPQIGLSNLQEGKTVNHYWIFNENGTYGTADVTFNWDAAQVDAGANTANFSVDQYYSDASIWSIIPSNNPQPTSIVATGITSFTDMSYSVGETIIYATNDYRTINTGAWDNVANWEIYNGSVWVAASQYPTASNAESIVIRSGHTILSPPAPISIDQTRVNAGGILVINNLALLTIADGTGIDLVNEGMVRTDGNLDVLGTFNNNSGGTFEINGNTISGPGTINILDGSVIDFQSSGPTFQGGLIVNNYANNGWSLPGQFTLSGTNTTINNYAQLEFYALGEFIS
ncbi:MAG: hypothetical protein IPJ79_08840 [Bacteroidetes bacterium]|nr:hypothetical protein [Bacteroidota bacterium]